MSNYSDIQYHGDNKEVSEYVKKVVPQKIIEWYSPEPNLQLLRFFYCTQTYQLMIMPCFWPHLLVLSPMFCCFSYAQKMTVMHSTIVLTEESVHFIQEPFTVCGYPHESQNKSLQISQLSNVNIKEIPPSCFSPGMVSMAIPGIYYQAYPDKDGFSALMYGTNQLLEFKSAILKQQQVVGQNINVHPLLQSGGEVISTCDVATALSIGSITDSSHDMLAGLKKMLDEGLIDQSDYIEQKKVILAKMTS